ncbi:ANKRD17 [Symbiodinium pilosum]|uniref:ANKRD17 protein n=1 Tax=Symbiodinium pilosum TaxID=2952 RepID=A0A812NZN5_SYMPI|nr:ANKRD17 [Symbiodinium pilosum]
MLDASSFGVVCVKVRTANDLKLIMDALTPELTLTQDLIINDKVLEEGKQLGLLGKEMVDSRMQLEQLISEAHNLDEQGRYDPVIDMSFLNMSSMKDSCSQIQKQMQKQEEDKRKQEQAQLQAELDEEDMREDKQLLEEAGDLSYKIPKREWDSQFVQDSSPQKVASGRPNLEAKTTEKRITRYMTAEPDDKGVVKVYIDDPDVANASKDNISVTFSMSTYTVRVASSPSLVLGPIECGVIDPEESSWRLSQGKRLTLSLVLSEAGKNNFQQKKRWEEFEAKVKAQKEKKKEEGDDVAEPPARPAPVAPAAPEGPPPMMPIDTPGASYRNLGLAGLVALLAVLIGLWLSSRQ